MHNLNHKKMCDTLKNLKWAKNDMLYKPKPESQVIAINSHCHKVKHNSNSFHLDVDILIGSFLFHLKKERKQF